MKTKRFCKSTVSLILAVMMLVSMLTVGIVNTSAAETDVAQTGAGTITVYFTNNKNYSNLKIHYWGGDTSTSWPGKEMTFVENNDMGEAIYKATIPSNTTGIIFNDNGSSSTQTKNITDIGDGYLYYPNTENPDGQWTCAIDKETYTNGGTDDPDDPTSTPTVAPTTPSGGGSSSDTFPFTFTEGERTVYLVDKAGWGSAKCYAWKSGTTTSNAGWPGVDMSDTGKTMNGYKIYSYEVASTYDMVIFCNSDSNKTGDLTYTQYAYYTNSDNAWTTVGATGGTDDPDNPFENPDWNKLVFRDDTSDSIDDNYDTNIFVSFDNGTTKTQMTKTVDTMSGHDMWIIDKPATTPTTVKFYGVKATDKKFSGSALYTWTATYSGCTTGLYCATSTSAGKWGTSSEPYEVPDSDDINNLSFGIWADTQGNGNTYDCVVTRKISSSEFHLYLPSNTPTPTKLYTSFAALTIGSTTVTDGTAVTLENGESYTMSYKQTEYDSTTKSATLKVYKTLDNSADNEGIATLHLHTKRPLFTELAVNMSGEYKDYKEIDTKGSYYMYDEAGDWVNTPKTEDDGSITDRTGLKKIKGRGNSTFEASMKLYGKYAYNINLDETVELIDGAQKSKKWCLLANNVDHSMMRNSFIYAIGDEIGLKYSPETRLVNLYNNGNYMGAYVITEKVEYGKNTLMNDAKSLDKYHEDLFNTDTFDYEDNIETATGTYNGVSYQYAKGTGDFTFEHTGENAEKYKEYNFLLEFELKARYKDEYSWFVSPKGQAVVVKYPEFATQKEMKWIIDQFVAVENAVYAKNYNTYKDLIDVESFAKMYMIQELTKNLDSCATSYYIHNDQSTGKLAASPVWDYDWSMGSYYKYKPLYGGSNSYSMDNPEQWFVKNKPMNTDPYNADGSNSVYNFQAQLAQQSDFWTVCQKIWTNDMYSAIGKYVDTDATGTADGGIIVDEWLTRFESALDMNYARWNGYGSNITSEDWGTKRTRGYKYGSYNFTPGNASITGTTATDSMANTIYYLNDWLAKRSKWMNDNGLYNASLVDPYKLNSVTLNATQSGANVTVSVDFDATYNGTQIVDTYKAYDLYVNGSLYKEACAITETPVVTLKENVETSIYVVAYLTGDKDAYNMKSATKKFTYVVTGPEYKVENVSFTAVQSDDKSTVTITPSATVTVEGVTVDDDQIEYTVYLNGEAVDTKTFADGSLDVTIPEGQTSEIYIKVSPAGVTAFSGTSAKQTFSYGMQKVKATLYFKSSSSLRYAPKIVMNDVEIEMTQSGSAIGKNASQTQSYYWYTAEVDLEENVPTTIKFKNEYSMDASTTLTLSAAKTFYFGVDNLNNGTEVVDLTDAEEYIRNFKQSASHMVWNEATDPELATTSINGKILKMGDANEDGKFNISDATATQRALAELDTLSETGEALADFNLDGTKSIMDVTEEQTKLVS